MADNHAAAQGARRGGATPQPQAPPSLFTRRVAAVVVGVFFLSHMDSFAPVSWIIQPDWKTELDGVVFVDRVIAPTVIIGAVIMHWYIAEAIAPFLLAFTVPNPGGNNGAQAGQPNNGQMAEQTIVLGLWKPSYFWPGVVLEIAVLWGLWPLADWVVGDTVRRSALVALLAGVWFVGWNALPPHRKAQVWTLVKESIIQMFFSEMINSAFGGRQRRRRR